MAVPLVVSVFTQGRVLSVVIVGVRVASCGGVIVVIVAARVSRGNADRYKARQEMHVLLTTVASAIAALKVTVHIEAVALRQLDAPHDPSLASWLVCPAVEVLTIDNA